MAKHRILPDGPAAFDHWASMAAWNGPILSAFAQASAAYMKGCMEWQQEVARFISARLEDDRRAGRFVCECRSMQEMSKLQQDWMQTAAKAYTDEAENLSQIASRWVQAMSLPFSEANKPG